MTVSRLTASSYLIIGGTTKAATTSLFAYLGAHPQVCAASLKETRFFLDKEYPLPSKLRFEDGLEKYAEFFLHCHNDLPRLEATPDYLHSRGTPQKIKSSLPNVKLIFSLREPVSRLISWYRFAKQTGRLSEQTSFEEYVSMQRPEGSQAEQHLQALEQGLYSRYLDAYYKLFDRSQIHVVFYEELSENPVEVLRSICEFSGLDPDFYSDYTFEVFNRTQAMKSSSVNRLYMLMRYNIIRVTHNKPVIQMTLRRLKMLLEPVYLRLNTRLPEERTFSASCMRMLEEYYKPERDALANLLEKPLPRQWNRNTTASPNG